jgi:pyruvate formate lyase activating enzyme
LVTGTVFDIKRFSIHDGPGIRTTVFLKGCALRCWWCHNPESQGLGPELMVQAQRCIGCGACLDACSQGALYRAGDQIQTVAEQCTLCGACVEACYAEARQIVGRTMTVEQVMDEIERDLAFFDESGGGVTFSGGEPLMQPTFLLALLRACQSHDIHTTLDTCGYASWPILAPIRQAVDLFLYDLKVMAESRHRQLTGVSNRQILDNLQALSAEGHDIVLRLPLIPGINDDEANIHQIGAFAAALPHRHRIELLPYHPTATDKYRRLQRDYRLPDLSRPSEPAITRVRCLLQAYGLQVNVGG